MQEKHSTFNDENIWKNDFNVSVVYSHGTFQSCGFVIAFFWKCLANIYNDNMEVEQVQVLSKLSKIMKNINFSDENRIVLAGVLNVFIDRKLETKGSKTSLKQKSIAELLELKEEYNLCDIWRIRNLTKKLYTFRQNHSSGIINSRLDFIFISNKLQEFSNDTHIIPAFKTDYSSVLVTISN